MRNENEGRIICGVENTLFRKAMPGKLFLRNLNFGANYFTKVYKIELIWSNLNNSIIYSCFPMENKNNWASPNSQMVGFKS